MTERRTDILPGICEVGPCQNIGEWVPVLLVYPVGYAKHKVLPMEVELGMPVCDHHRVILSPVDLLPDDVWEQINDILYDRRALKGDRAACELRFIRIPQPGDPDRPLGPVH